MHRRIAGDLRRRLRVLEIAEAKSKRIEIWRMQDDGTLLGTDGERLTRKAFERRYLPGCPDVFVMNPTDAKL
jgi:hypothetical protein